MYAKQINKYAINKSAIRQIATAAKTLLGVS